MTNRRPLYLNNGIISELLDGDTVSAGISSTEIVAGSGLEGGGSVSVTPRLDVNLAASPSGLIFVGNSLGIDGEAQTAATTALASGIAAEALAVSALASGNNALAVSQAALASGNAALVLTADLEGDITTQYIAATPIVSGYSVGLNDAGQVESVAGQLVSDNSNPMVFGSPVIFSASGINNSATSTSYNLANNSFVVSYSDDFNGDRATACVGAISGVSPVFGTPVVFGSGLCTFISSLYDPVGSGTAIFYRDGGFANYGLGIVGTVSGTTISFGPPTIFSSVTTSVISSTYSTVDNKTFTLFRDGPGDDLQGVVGTISGTSISFGTRANIQTNRNPTSTSAVFDPGNNQVVCVSTNDNLSDRGEVNIVRINGDTFTRTFGTFTFTASATNRISSIYDPTTERIVIWYTNSAANRGDVITARLYDSYADFGSFSTFDTGTALFNSATYHSEYNRVVNAYRDGNNSNYGTAVVGTVSGSSITFGTPVVFESAQTDQISSDYDSTNKQVLISYQDVGNANYGTAVVADSLFDYTYSPTLSGQPNFIGISQSTVQSGEVCLVNLPGTIYTDSSADLIPSAFYYPDPTTSGITLSGSKPPDWQGQTLWKAVGRAVSPSGLILLDSL